MTSESYVPSGLIWEGLAAAIDRIARPENWIQDPADPDNLALDKHGNPCLPIDKTAAKWTLNGALTRARLDVFAGHAFNHEARLAVANATGENVGPYELIGWNNAPRRTHLEVLTVLHKAFEADAAAAQQKAEEHLISIRAGALQFVDDTAFPEARIHVDRIHLTRQRIAKIVGAAQ